MLSALKWGNVGAVVMAVALGYLSSHFFTWSMKALRVVLSSSNLLHGKTLFPTLQGLHVVVTGGSSGIGYSLAEQALTEGAEVTLIARDSRKLRQAKETLVHELKGLASAIHVKAADVSEPEAITAAIREAHERAPIDILICNAGIIIPGHFDDVSTKDLEETVTTNVLGSLYPIHAAIPLMKQRCGPNTPQSIVLVSSVAGLTQCYGANVYASTKYAQRGIAEVLRWELLPYNIHAHVVCPGFVDTPMTKLVTAPTKLGRISRALNAYDRNAVVTPSLVANCTWNGVKRGIFLITTDWRGGLFALLSRGPVPEESVATNVWELLLLVPVRLLTHLHKSGMKKTILHLAAQPEISNL